MKFNIENFNQAMSLTQNWNFELTINKIIKTKTDWNIERTEKAILNYRRYIAITKALNGVQLVPNGDIDEIWHLHILNTAQYMKDCDELFGAYLHHYPFFGMINKENNKQWIEVQNGSEALWEKLFSEKLYLPNSQAAKCPQACPCTIDDVMITKSMLASMKLRA